MKMQYIYPTKEQRIKEVRKKLIKSPKTREEASRNKELNKEIEKIKEVF